MTADELRAEIEALSDKICKCRKCRRIDTYSDALRKRRQELREQLEKINEEQH